MQGQSKIIDDILTSAKKTAAAMIDEATAELDGRLEALRAELEAKLNAEAEKSKAAADSLYDGRIKLGELEAKKVLLKAKQDCVSAVYDGVKQRILSAPDAEYLSILQKLIVAECNDGDEIVVAKSDAKRVTGAWVKKVSAAAGKKLTLSEEKGDFSGGVILRNKKYDRGLTVDEIVEELKERTVADTVKDLEL